MQSKNKIRAAASFLAVLIACVGATIAIFSVLAPSLGFGSNTEFFLYKLYAWTRNDVGHLGLNLFLGGAILWFLPRIPWNFIRRISLRLAHYGTTQVRLLLAASFGSVLKVVAINLVIITIGLIVIEIFARAFLPPPPIYTKTFQPGQYFRFQPYMQSSNEGPLDTDGVWYDPVHDENIPYHVRSNSLGFRIDHEIDTTTRYAKKSNERVVLIFGGSSVYGFGNTSNETTSAGYLQKFLNAKSKNGLHYTVFNMGNGGWVSYQEFIALNLYGLNLDPDWIIFCDGRNDIFTIPALVGDDVGFHFSTPMMRQFINGYFYHHQKPDFFRGQFENELLKRSAAYRYFTGKLPVAEHEATRFSSSRGWADVERTVDFYEKTQRSVLHQCDHCQYILSTQPIFRGSRSPMTANQRAALRAQFHDLVITGSFASDPRFEEILLYDYGRMVDEMPGICAEFGPRCHYIALNNLFPADKEHKNKFFVDDVHLRNEGNAVIANAYAKIILATDRDKGLAETTNSASQ